MRLDYFTIKARYIPVDEFIYLPNEKRFFFVDDIMDITDTHIELCFEPSGDSREWEYLKLQNDSYVRVACVDGDMKQLYENIKKNSYVSDNDDGSIDVEKAFVYTTSDTPIKIYELDSPTNLDDCYPILDVLTADIKDSDEFFTMSENEALAKSHHGFGTMLRNELGLWGDSVLAKWFKTQGIEHADDMSGIIITSYHRKKNGKYIELNKQIEQYKQYWKDFSENAQS